MELDKAFELAVVLAWEDLTKISDPCSVRVEYRCEPGTSLDQVSVWSTGADSCQKLVCDYWTPGSLTHDGGARFRNGYCSDKLVKSFDFIMTNQQRFTRHADACRDGLALIYPPNADDRADAEIRLGATRDIQPDFGAGDVQCAPAPGVLAN